MSGKTKQSAEHDIYTLVSLAVILLSVAILAYLMMTLAGFDFKFDDPPAYMQTQPEPNQEPAESIAVTPVETAPETESETSAETAPETFVAEGEPDQYLLEDEGRVLPVFEASLFEDIFPDTVLKSTSDQGREYLDRIVFLGDSTTYGLARYSMLRDGRATKQVWTPLSGTLTLSQATITKIYYPDDDCELIITEAVERKKPEILVVTLGVNGISFMGEEYFVGEYEKLIEQIREVSPDTKIILQSIFPVAASYKALAQINNEKITAANSWIAELANKLGIWYLDTYSVLVGEDGYLPEEYQNGDGMHLNETSFTIELDYIRTHAIPEYVNDNTLLEPDSIDDATENTGGENDYNE